MTGTRGWIIDVDGCLVRTTRTGGQGGELMPEAAEFLTELRRRGEPYIVCTNASEHPPEVYSRSLRSLGLDIPDANFATAGTGAADYLADHYHEQSVVAIGSEGFVQTLTERGVHVVEPGDWSQAGAVVVGAAQEYRTAQINAGALAVEAGADLYSTVTDPWFHGGLGKSISSSSAIAAAVGWATGKTATVLGKPSAALAFTLARQLNIEPADVVVVGDAFAEIELAHHLGGTAYLVLSGATQEGDLATQPPHRQPTRIFPAIADIHNYLTTELARSTS